MNHTVKILAKENLTHDVIHWKLEQPASFHYSAGQAVELSLEEGEDKWSPFTMTNLDGGGYLEFMTKIYPEHKGLTAAFSRKAPGDEVIITDPWDSFKFAGPGIFIAGGTGITPFVAILRQLKKDNNIGSSRLFFSNKTKNDIFLEAEFKNELGAACQYITTRERVEGCHYGRINEAYLKENVSDFNQPFYVCGPDRFIEDIREQLLKLGVEKDLVDLNL
jgi:ferredoxin-NADP reductase